MDKQNKAESELEGMIAGNKERRATLEKVVKGALLSPGVASAATGAIITFASIGVAAYGVITHHPASEYALAAGFGVFIVGVPLLIAGYLYLELLGPVVASHYGAERAKHNGA